MLLGIKANGVVQTKRSPKGLESNKEISATSQQRSKRNKSRVIDDTKNESQGIQESTGLVLEKDQAQKQHGFRGTKNPKVAPENPTLAQE